MQPRSKTTFNNIEKACYEANLNVFCRCGWLIEIFNGELGMCANNYCPEYSKLYQFSILIEPVEYDASQTNPS